MKSYFELRMERDGQYFFRAMAVSGERLAESERYLTRQSAMEGMERLLELCRAEPVACYDTTRQAWRELTG